MWSITSKHKYSRQGASSILSRIAQIHQLQSPNMVTINLAYTAPINPAGASPVLTESQVWTGLKRKVRRAHEFVPVIVACEVISEEGNTVVRKATFSAQGNPKETNEPVREVCVHFPPSRVDFKQDDGSTISNIVSRGPEGELLMTYAFEWKHDHIQEGSDEATATREKYFKMAKMAVEGSINTIRKFVREGEIS